MSKVAVIGIAGESVFLPVEQFHIGGETLTAKSIHTEIGGKGFNQAVAARRYGVEVGFLCAVGNEGYDAVIEKFMRDEKISAVLCKKEDRTAYAVIIVDKLGRNRVTEYTGAKLDETDIKPFETTIKSSKVLLLNNEIPLKVNLAAAKIAKANGAMIILNPAPYRENGKEFDDLIDLFTPNEHEYIGYENRNNVIITLGERGCFIKSENRTISPIKVTAVDTTGAGDTFSGYLAAAIADGAKMNEAVNIAMRAAALSVTRNGAVSSIPLLNELK